MKYDDNVYEINHVIDITLENDKESKIISSTFNIAKASSLKNAKELLNDAIPKGKASNIETISKNPHKVIYTVIVGYYRITHKIIIKKNGISLRNIDPSSDTYTSITEDNIVKNKEDKVSKSKKTNRPKSKDKPEKDTLKKTTRRGGKRYKRNKRSRTITENLDLKALEDEIHDDM